jgi:hypothetical protein
MKSHFNYITLLAEELSVARALLKKTGIFS